MRALLHRGPFVPFVIRMANVPEILIDHPDAVAWGDPDRPSVLFVFSRGAMHEVALESIATLREA